MSIQYVSDAVSRLRSFMHFRMTAYNPKTTTQSTVSRIVLMMRPRIWEKCIHTS